MGIEDWRSEIDAIDMELLQLLNTRARLAIKVGAIKRSACLPLCDPLREAEILDRVCAANRGPLEDCVVGKLFRHIIAASRHAEKENCEEGAVAEVAL